MHNFLSLKKIMELFSFCLNFKVETELLLEKYPSIALRGGMGMSMKHTFCVMGKKKSICRDCLLAETCPYARVFESVSLQNLSNMKKATHYPHPFAITPLFNGPISLKAGENFAFSITIVGSAIKYLPHIVFSIEKLGAKGLGKHRGKFSLCHITNVVDGRNYNLEELTYENGNFLPVSLEYQKVSNIVEIEFLTPCRLKKEGKTLQTIDFVDIVNHLQWQRLFRALQP